MHGQLVLKSTAIPILNILQGQLKFAKTGGCFQDFQTGLLEGAKLHKGLVVGGHQALYLVVHHFYFLLRGPHCLGQLRQALV